MHLSGSSSSSSNFGGGTLRGGAALNRTESILSNSNMFSVNPKISNGHVNLSHALTNMYRDSYIRLCYYVRSMMPCYIVKLQNKLSILDEGIVELSTTAIAFRKVNRIPPHITSTFDYRIALLKLKQGRMMDTR